MMVSATVCLHNDMCVTPTVKRFEGMRLVLDSFSSTELRDDAGVLQHDHMDSAGSSGQVGEAALVGYG